MRHKQAFTLIELSMVVVMAAVLSSALMPDFVRSLHIEAARKTALEMSQVAEAARNYYVDQRVWPDGLEALKARGFLDADWMAEGPFGHAYVLEPEGAVVKVKTEVPQDMTGVLAGLLPMTTVESTSVAMTVTPPGAALAGVPAGTIVPWTAASIPDGWLVCDGQHVSRTAYAQLFAVIGTHYGAGDGLTTFALPDLRGRTVVGLDVAAGVLTAPQGSILGGIFGAEKHRLSVSEMPVHTHAIGTGLGPNGSGRGELEGTYSNAHVIDHAAVTGPAGAGEAHNIVQPSMALYWIIRT